MNIAVKMPSGETVKAPTEEWVAALIVMLPAHERRALCERIAKKVIAYETPGSYILRAEGIDKVLKP